jgi:hypothetical protein
MFYIFNDLFDRATVIQMNKTNMNQVVTGNVVLPGILRNGQGNLIFLFDFN